METLLSDLYRSLSKKSIHVEYGESRPGKDRDSLLITTREGKKYKVTIELKK